METSLDVAMVVAMEVCRLPICNCTMEYEAGRMMAGKIAKRVVSRQAGQ